jgi:aminopeptidase N
MAGEGPVDPWALHDAREALRMRISAHLGERLRALHTRLQMVESFSPDAAQAGRRALRNAALDLMVAVTDGDAIRRAVGHFDAARNMTDQMGGLSALTLVGGEALDRALKAFYDQWKSEPLVIDKWFSVQARSPAPDAFGRVLGLTAHPDFDSRNPNRLRALVMGFSVGNPYRFHAPDGEGYRFLADQILSVDSGNPSVAARMVEPLSSWARFEPRRAELMRGALSRVLQHPALSKNVAEVATRAMGR